MLHPSRHLLDGVRSCQMTNISWYSGICQPMPEHLEIALLAEQLHESPVTAKDT